MLGSIESVHWELTNHCNFHCVHCYLHTDSRRELNTQEIFRVLDELEEAGVLSLTLTGGEPLLRKDFPEIYRYAHGKGFLLTVFTNGSRITPDYVKLFQEFPPQKVEITVNGITKETLEAVTAKPGSFEGVFRGISLLHEGGIFLGLKTNGMTLNAHELPEIMKFARGLPNSFFKFDTAIMARRDQDKGPTQYRLRPSQVTALIAADAEATKQMTDDCRARGDMVPPERAVFTCAAGRESFHISAWGDLHPCHTVRPIRVSLLNHGFLEAAGKVQQMVNEVRYPEVSKCGSCSIYALCNSCPGTAQLEGKGQIMPADYFCEVAHETVKEFGVVTA